MANSREPLAVEPLAVEPLAVEPLAVEPLVADATETADAAGTASTSVDDAEAARTSSTLSERDVAILTFERQWWRHAGAKEQGIRAEFGLSAARYYQVLGVLLDSPQALAHDPMLVNRLHRMREARAEARAHRALPVT